VRRRCASGRSRRFRPPPDISGLPLTPDRWASNGPSLCAMRGPSHLHYLGQLPVARLRS
jgi:hypothetical protein